MTFFNRKEEVIDLKLTQFGKHLLSKGVLRPVYYAFFDDDILYDGQFAGVTETQNAIEDRIKQTPRLRTQHVFHGIETEIKKSIAYQRMAAQENDALDRNAPKITLPQSQPELHYTNASPLGTARLGSQNTARWNIDFLAGNYTGSISYISSSATPAVKIPQINAEVVRKTIVQISDALDDDDDFGFIDDPEYEDAFSPSLSFEDGTKIVLKKDDLVLEIQEKNGFTLNKSFDLEIYEIENEVLDGLPTGKEILIPLFFPEEELEYTITSNDIYKREPNRDFKSDPIDPTKVEYFFDVQADSEISSDIMCKLRPVDKTKGVFSKRFYKCPNPTATQPSNIYGVEDDYEDPCE